MKNMRVLEPFEDYFWEFYNDKSEAVQTKIDYVLQIIITIEQIPKKFFKHIEDGIYEIRIKSGSDIYRLFSFFDEGKLVILLHGFTKKTQKLPRREIDKAMLLRRAYYESKKS
ncbi:MAG: type II toxin-antitoxin system RelE/ParE family toxin [Flavobacteriales bacterium]|nr:type II toxin-antitoxin system RelE/ParE family toxin [Flavobacteriales bacterium]